MPYVSKAERNAESVIARTQVLEHVQLVEQCEGVEAWRQIANAIADMALSVRWADERPIPKNIGPVSVRADHPPTNTEYWLEAEIDPQDPDRIREPRPYDPKLVDKRRADELDKTRRFRKPLFPRWNVQQLWPIKTELKVVAMQPVPGTVHAPSDNSASKSGPKSMKPRMEEALKELLDEGRSFRSKKEAYRVVLEKCGAQEGKRGWSYDTFCEVSLPILNNLPD